MIILGLIYGLMLLIIGILLMIYSDSSYIVLVILGGLCIYMTISIIIDEPKPTKQDVLDGKAYYQETQVIMNNDTIKTYDIDWNQKTGGTHR